MFDNKFYFGNITEKNIYSVYGFKFEKKKTIYFQCGALSKTKELDSKF